MAQKRDISGQEKTATAAHPGEHPMATYTYYVPASPELVYALVLARESRDADEATVLFAMRGYRRDQHGDPITTVGQLIGAVMAYIGHPLPYRNDFEGEPRVFGEDPREGGDLNDLPESPPKPLRVDMLDQYIRRGKIDATRRGDAGEQNPYYVLATRAPRVGQGKCCRCHAVCHSSLTSLALP